MQAIAYGKIYELLHKQIWRKAPSRVKTYAIASIPTFNGRPVTFVRHWNIKSPSKNPYSYSVPDGTPADMTFGLNQLFMGQDYRKKYIGNPKDGIYHDDCYITPKMIPATNEGYYNCWGYYTDSYYDSDGMSTVYISQTFDKQDAEGNVVINNVTLETYIVNTTNYKRLRIDNAEGSDTIIELGSFDPLEPSTDGLTTGKSNNPYGAFGYRKWKSEFDELESVHGTYSTEIQSQPIFSLATMAFAYGWIRVYEDGTVIEYSPESYEYGDPGYYTTAHYKILPMMYTDTGDLVMDRVEFVEKWNDYFDLVVHEDSEWWEAWVKPIVVIITIVVAANTGLLINPIGAIGTALSVVGTLSGDKTLGLIGGAMMLGASLYEMGVEQVAQETLNNAAPSMTIGAARDIARDATLGQVFEGLTGIGMGNLAQIGAKLYGLANDIKMLGMEMPTMETTVADESGMSITMKDNSEEDLFAELYKKIGV